MEENKELGKRVANESINTAIVRQSFVPVEEDKFKDKNYMVSVRAALDSYCTVDKNNHRIIYFWRRTKVLYGYVHRSRE